MINQKILNIQYQTGEEKKFATQNFKNYIIYILTCTAREAALSESKICSPVEIQ